MELDELTLLINKLRRATNNEDYDKVEELRNKIYYLLQDPAGTVEIKFSGSMKYESDDFDADKLIDSMVDDRMTLEEAMAHEIDKDLDHYANYSDVHITVYGENGEELQYYD